MSKLFSTTRRSWSGRVGGLGLAVLLLIAPGGCVEPELGDIPFRCNNGSPACPEGYRCVQQGLEELCVRQGYRFPDSGAWVDAAPDQDSGLPPQRDSRVPGPDRALSLDTQLPRWDLGPVDATVNPPPKDSGEPQLLCQSSADCTSSNEPCCCPMPLVPIFQVCLAFCLDPFCLF